jgi:hypothetical protein
MLKHFWIPIAVLLLSLTTPLAASESIQSSIEKIRAVAKEGQGNGQAGVAWKNLAAADPKSIPAILAGMDGANDLAMNWLRNAIDTIVAKNSAKKLPIAKLETFVKDRRHQAKPRRLAFELIQRAEPARAQKMIASFGDDPANELRREAIDKTLSEAALYRTNGDKGQAINSYRAALLSAREVDQIDGIAKTLRELGEKVELPKVFGWVANWKAIGPFDSTNGIGFEKVYPPETNVDFQTEVQGLNGKVRWQDLKATGDYGLVDLNKPCGALKSVAGYAATEFVSPAARTVELRLGTENAWKVWVNGKFLFAREEYHRGSELDQYRIPCELKPGKNIILVKLCQNEQVEDWTKGWEFQLRVTDSAGTPIESSK